MQFLICAVSVALGLGCAAAKEPQFFRVQRPGYEVIRSTIKTDDYEVFATAKISRAGNGNATRVACELNVALPDSHLNATFLWDTRYLEQGFDLSLYPVAPKQFRFGLVSRGSFVYGGHVDVHIVEAGARPERLEVSPEVVLSHPTVKFAHNPYLLLERYAEGYVDFTIADMFTGDAFVSTGDFADRLELDGVEVAGEGRQLHFTVPCPIELAQSPHKVWDEILTCRCGTEEACGDPLTYSFTRDGWARHTQGKP